METQTLNSLSLFSSSSPPATFFIASLIQRVNQIKKIDNTPPPEFVILNSYQSLDSSQTVDLIKKN